MKKLIYLASCLSVASFMYSCKKETKTTTPTTTTTTNNNNGTGPVINYTPEQNKSNLQQTGLDAIKEMDEAKNMKVIDNIIHFSELVDINDPMEKLNATTFMPSTILNSLIKFHETGDVEVVYSAMKQTKSLKNDETLETVFNDAKGTYTWNLSTNKWDFTAGNSLVFKFPATKQNLGNNASYTIDYTPYTGNAAANELKGNMPNIISAKLDIDNVNYLAFDFKAGYDAEGIPTSLVTSLKVENFNFSLEMNSSSSNASSKFAFMHSGKNVLAMGFSIAGNFAKSNLENLETNIKETEDINKLVTSMSGYFQVLNVKLETSANVQAFTDDIRSKGGSDNIKNDSDWANLINKHLVTSVYYTDRNAKIGKGEMYMKPYTNTYTVWENNQNIQKTETGEEMNVRIVFEDGSKIDIESYLNNGFDKLENELENFLNSMENNYNL